MKKEIRSDLATQAEYARLKSLTRGRINQMVKAGELPTVTIKGAVLIKLT